MRRRLKVGLGWRAEIGAGIIAHLDSIDVVEVLAEEFFDATDAEKRALRFLASQVPVVLHATSLGLASTQRVDVRRLEAMARLVDWLEPELWSEHLAFVRWGDIEIGHLAAPPRNDQTLEGLHRNLGDARRIVGSLPLLENVATLIDPPMSDYEEGEWLRTVIRACEIDLLLDLHNLYANARNFGFNAGDVVRNIPAERIGAIHLAGGRIIEGGRVLDDHLHEVPAGVFDLLEMIAPDTAPVIIERDGNYPPMAKLITELERARKVCRPMCSTS